MRLSKSNNSKGFTIIELMISTVIFSIMLVLCLAGIVQVSRAYYKGVTHSRTQESARLLMDEITQAIQLSGSTISYLSPVDGFNIVVTGPEVDSGKVTEGTGVICAGNKQYTYALDRKVSSVEDETNKEIRHAILSEDIKCSDALMASDLNQDISGSQRSLLSENMRLTKFSVTRVTPNLNVSTKTGSQLWKVEISIAYGDQDLLSYTDDSGADRVICNPGTGTEFCSIVELSTIVSRRIG